MNPSKPTEPSTGFLTAAIPVVALVLGLAGSGCSDSGGAPDSGPADLGAQDQAGVDGGPADLGAQDQAGVDSGGTPVVAVSSGKLRGVAAEGALAFLGIPYAAPPVGTLRWRAPQPVAAWSGVRDASKYGAVCPQLAGGNNTARAPAGTAFGAEDCLLLNVWTPSLTGGPFPVMVFLHGGGNNNGSSIQPIGDLLDLGQAGPPIYEGQRLAERGKVVVVTVNYRLGVLGFLIHDELAKEDAASVSGNYGIRDQIAALQWVQANIGKLGGDPQRVTLFGQSGGGRDVAILLASPLAKGLFQRAILHSAPYNVQPQSYFTALHAKLIGEVGCDKASPVITCLRGKAAADLVKAKAAQALGAASFPFHPSVDGHVLKESPPVAFAKGAFNQVPVMGGTTEAEHSHWSQFQNLTQPAYEALMKNLVATNPSRLSEALALYPVSKYGDYSSAFIAAYDDRGATCGAVRNLGAIAVKNSRKTFMYRFKQVLSTDKRLGFGAYHTSDLLFLFQHMGGTHFTVTQAERDVEAAMLEYWTRFAAGGDPSGGKQPGWKALTPAGGAYQILASPPSSATNLKQKECAFWASVAGAP